MSMPTSAKREMIDEETLIRGMIDELVSTFRICKDPRGHFSKSRVSKLAKKNGKLLRSILANMETLYVVG